MHFHFESGALLLNRMRFVAEGCWVSELATVPLACNVCTGFFARFAPVGHMLIALVHDAYSFGTLSCFSKVLNWPSKFMTC